MYGIHDEKRSSINSLCTTFEANLIIIKEHSTLFEFVAISRFCSGIDLVRLLLSAVNTFTATCSQVWPTATIFLGNDEF